MIAEMEEYEREVLYPPATEQVEIDLDNGVKVNYPKLGKVLKKIPGLEAKPSDVIVALQDVYPDDNQFKAAFTEKEI